MSEPIISVRSLGKKYLLGNAPRHDTLRDRLADTAARLFQRDNRPASSDTTEFWALKDVAFDVQPGEVVGIIGRNGAGKSTLLKLLSQITEPTTGEIRLRGRVASLLEVGTGFHPELTGRENVFLNGAILGMSQAEIRKKFDEIVDFADIEKFLDTPVKRYSSGMYVRLAFAVAAHLEPEILIVDEVLAVGDIQFQRKCLGKMGQVSQEGRTVLLVSHNMQAVSTLCKKVVVLKAGTVALQGTVSEGIAEYLKSQDNNGFTFVNKSPNGSPQLISAEVITSEPSNVHKHGEELVFNFSLYTPKPLRSAVFSFQILDKHLQPIVHSWIFSENLPFCLQEGISKLSCTIPAPSLYLGDYSLATHFSEAKGGEHFETLEGICPFRIEMLGMDRPWPWQEDACKYLEKTRWETI